MIISTVGGNPFSILFMIYNFIIFTILKNTILKNAGIYGVNEYLLILIISLISATLYNLLCIKSSESNDKYIIKNHCYYLKEIDCNLFNNDIYKANYIFELKEDKCNVYVNENIILAMLSLKVNIDQSMDMLKFRICNLNLEDKLCVYLYKYMYNILISIEFFLILGIANNINLGGDTNLIKFIIFSVIMLIFCILIYLCFHVNKFVMNIIKKIMTKRELDYIFFKNEQ